MRINSLQLNSIFEETSNRKLIDTFDNFLWGFIVRISTTDERRADMNEVIEKALNYIAENYKELYILDGETGEVLETINLKDYKGETISDLDAESYICGVF